MFFADISEKKELFMPLTDLTGAQRDEEIQARKFILADWSTEVLAPAFNRYNPTRQLLPEFLKVTARVCFNASFDIHTDADESGHCTYVTLGVSREGKPANTLHTLNSSLKRQRITDLHEDTVDKNFIWAPEFSASIFDPNANIHTAHPAGWPGWENDRVLYRLAYRHSPKSNEPIITPSLPGVSFPLFRPVPAIA
jgi:hypothetical protein